MVTRVIGMLLRKSFLVFVFGLSLGCPKDPRTCQDGNIVAKVGEDQVSQSQLLAELARRGIPRTQDKEKQLVLAKYILENLIEERLLYLAA